MRVSAFLILLLLFSVLAVQAAQLAEFYVATNGSDTNPGTKAKPFATLEHARDILRLSKLGPGGATVWLRGGVYHRTDTFTLVAGDGGMKDAPIVYRACEGETVRLVGGKQVKDFKPVTDPVVLSRLAEAARGKVLQADLKALGITDYGKLISRGFGRGIQPAGLELFFDNQPMTLARYPNDDWMKIADVPAGPNGGKFTFDGDRPARWAAEDGIWIHGYWTWDWAESYEKVKSIDLQTKEIATEPPHGIYGYKKGARWYALNLLCELTQPGEWYLDRKTGILYFWPPKPIGKSEAWVSLLDTPIITMTDTSCVTIRGLSIECTRGDGIVVTGGKQNLIAGCRLTNIGNVGVVIGSSPGDYVGAVYNNTLLDRKGGSGNGVVGCDIAHCGEGGVILGGGDRLKLVPGGNYVENCDISDYSYWVRTYRGAVGVDGVGNRIAHNYIHDAPHCGILLHGNEHVIEFNDIHRVCMETSDAGGFYLGRDFSERGNIVRYNYFRELGREDVRAVYLDDNASDVRVYGNVFYKAGMGVCIGGGRDNIVTNNIFVGCRPSIMMDNRGEGWAKGTVDGLMKQRIEVVNYTQPPWSQRYPELLSLYADNANAPKYNVIEKNLSFDGRWLKTHKNPDPTNSVKDNLVDIDPGFIDSAHGDFRLKDDSPAWNLGFKRIPMEQIGLQKDEYRTR